MRFLTLSGVRGVEKHALSYFNYSLTKLMGKILQNRRTFKASEPASVGLSKLAQGFQFSLVSCGRTDGQTDQRTDGPTDGLTWVGARDTCVSKNESLLRILAKCWEINWSLGARVLSNSVCLPSNL